MDSLKIFFDFEILSKKVRFYQRKAHVYPTVHYRFPNEILVKARNNMFLFYWYNSIKVLSSKFEFVDIKCNYKPIEQYISRERLLMLMLLMMLLAITRAIFRVYGRKIVALGNRLIGLQNEITWEYWIKRKRTRILNCLLVNKCSYNRVVKSGF